jgi:2-oxoglutarate ferredoxin oxidoreductase subunit alpha
MAQAPSAKPIETLDDVAVRFAGDSGDGMQLVGAQFTATSAIMGNDLATLPDYPSEVRAPAGTLGGVSGFQIHFSSNEIHTPGDIVQVLVAMNPAALKVNLGDTEPKGVILANSDAFTPKNLKLARYEANPLEDESLSGYRVYSIPITTLTREAVSSLGLRTSDADRCKNFFALGLVYWLFDRTLEPTTKWLERKFARRPEIGQANALAMRAGFNFGETAEIMPTHYRVEKAELAPGVYRKVGGNEATALGLIAAASKAGKTLFYGSYPITPASEILHELARHANIGVKTFQAEDEIAAMCATIGAAFGGAFACTGTSGPGLSLKSEAMGLAVMLELPCVIVNVQRGGPSTGLPTKTEQADLLQALYGRHGECPIPVIAALSPSDCFDMAYEAFQIAVKYMTPVILLTDGYLGNGAEPWKVPDVSELPDFDIQHPTDPETFNPYTRTENLGRPWALPGTPGLAHRIGGLEKERITGDVSYDPLNHQNMTEERAAKIAKVAQDIPPQPVLGKSSGELLVVSWGGSYGAVRTAVERAQGEGLSVSLAALRHLNPMPADLGDLLEGFGKILVPELNGGQLNQVLQSRYLRPVVGLHKIQGRPFTVAEVHHKIREVLGKE